MKIKEIKNLDDLIGKIVPDSIHGHAAREVEKYVGDLLKIMINKGHGPDILELGIEIKTRDLNAVSPQTVADMSVDDILATPYELSHVHDKFQQQLRVFVKDNVIVDAYLFDFSSPHIQDKIKIAYEHARSQLIANPYLHATSSKGRYYGYFERCGDKKTLSFRFSAQHMLDLEAMARSTFNTFIKFL